MIFNSGRQAGRQREITSIEEGVYTCRKHSIPHWGYHIGNYQSQRGGGHRWSQKKIQTRTFIRLHERERAKPLRAES